MENTDLSFALYKRPNEDVVHSIVGKAQHTITPSHRTFVFAPFDSSQLPYYIPHQSAAIPAIDFLSLPHAGFHSTLHQFFIEGVTNIIAAIQANKFTKIVAARIAVVDRKEDFNPKAFFKKLCTQYPDTFVSLVYIHGVGLWLGATPELLLSYTDDEVSTYSLAATKSSALDTIWSAKEIEEQAIVTAFITEQLSPFAAAPIIEHLPRVLHAGNLRHLLTVLSCQPKMNTTWQDILAALHPTPAVSGMPQTEAIQYILSQEGFDRKFYTGYLGDIDTNDNADLYVNLRCVQVTQQQLLFYAGCGITVGSHPQQEWAETESKINVLQSLL